MTDRPPTTETRGALERELIDVFRRLTREEQRDAFADVLRRLILAGDERLPAVLRRQAE
jgi:hypothetical protein